MEVERREWNVESCTRLSAVHCRGGDSRARHCTGGKCGPMLKRQWPPSLSLRGGRRPTWQSREGSCVFTDSFPTMRPGTARLPRRFAPRNDKSEAITILTAAGTDCKCIAGHGCPLPCNGRCSSAVGAEQHSGSYRHLTPASVSNALDDIECLLVDDRFVGVLKDRPCAAAGRQRGRRPHGNRRSGRIAK